MKYFVVAGLLLAVPAMAQQVEPPRQRAIEMMLSREIATHESDLAVGLQMQEQIASLQAQVTALTTERDALKADQKPPATPAPAATAAPQ